jgi:hypothetical protein
LRIKVLGRKHNGMAAGATRADLSNWYRVVPRTAKARLAITGV